MGIIEREALTAAYWNEEREGIREDWVFDNFDESEYVSYCSHLGSISISRSIDSVLQR